MLTLELRAHAVRQAVWMGLYWRSVSLTHCHHRLLIFFIYYEPQLSYVTVAVKQLEGPPRPASQYDQRRMPASDGSGYGTHPKPLNQQMEAVSTPVLTGIDLMPYFVHNNRLLNIILCCWCLRCWICTMWLGWFYTLHAWHQMVPICSEWWRTEANEATQTHCYNPIALAYPVWAYYAHGR